MSHLTAWEQLKKQALLGTARQNETVALPEGLPAPQGTLEEKALFSMAALGTYLRVARDPLPAPISAADAAPPETLPECSPAAASILQTVQAVSVLLLPEALELLKKRGWRLPHAQLPALLESATAETGLRPALEQVMGQRGSWLAKQNPRWKWAIQTQGSTSEWDNGLPQERRKYLENLRHTDPDQARTLVEEGWKQEKAADRESFLQAFAIGLSAADEPFLEMALSDRSKNVREMAAQLLAMLPGSAYQKRMQERAQTLIVKKPVKLSVLKKMQGQADFVLDVNLPETLPEDWKQDQIQEKSQMYGLGDKGYWLVQVVQKVRPEFWTQHFSLSAKDFWELAAQNKDWGKHLLPAFTEAAKLARNTEWLEVIQAYTGTLMLEHFPEGQHERLIRDWLSHQRLPDVGVLRQFRPWSPDLSLQVLHVYSRQLKTINTNNYSRQYELERYLHQMVLYLHPHTLQQALVSHPSYGQVEHLIDLRLRMHKEI